KALIQGLPTLAPTGNPPPENWIDQTLPHIRRTVNSLFSPPRVPRAALKSVANAVCLSVKCCLATSKTARRKLENTQREDVSQGPSTFSKTFAMRQFSLASNCLS